MNKPKPDSTIKPNRLVMFSFQVLYAVIIIGFIFLLVKGIEQFFGFNLIEFVVDSLMSTKDAMIISYEAVDGTMPKTLESLFEIVEHSLTDAVVQGAAIMVLFILFTFNTKLEIYPDHLVYYKVFSRTDIQFNNIVKIYVEKTLGKVGSLHLELKDRKDPLKLVYVVDAEAKRNNLLSAVSTMNQPRVQQPQTTQQPRTTQRPS